MRFAFRALACFLTPLLFTPSLFAGTVIVGTGGIDPYQIDTLTGSVTPIVGLNLYLNLAATQGSGPGLIFTTSIVNLYEWSISQGQCVTGGFPCPGSYWNTLDHIVGIAYDSDHGILYGSDVSGLYRDWLSPNSYNATETFIGPLTTDVIEYVPGDGLYGIDGAELVWIDPSTANTTPVTSITFEGQPLFGLRDFAYDDVTGKLIASWFVDGPVSVGRLYLIDRTTGVATLLEQGPPIYGLAQVETVPEPGTFVLAGGVLLAAGALLRRTLTRSCFGLSSKSSAYPV